jgi:predicted NBD/HSP70 family sugar kinase
MDASDLRRHHLNAVLVRLLRKGPQSRAELTEELGLRRATVSQLVADLLERNLVEERPTPRSGAAGRPSTDIVATGRHVGALGLEVSRSRVAACLTNMTGELRVIESTLVDNRTTPPDEVMDRLASVLAQVLSDPRAAGITPIGATLGVPGVVEPHSGLVRVAPDLGWVDTDLVEMASRLGLPTELRLRVENEANMAAVAEQFFGVGRGLASFVYLSGGASLGASIVVEQRWVRGAHGLTGALAHVVVDPSGRVCSCGARGCLETIVGADAGTDPETMAEALATVLRPLIGVVDPHAFILGGHFAELGEPFAEMLHTRLTTGFSGTLWTSGAVLLGRLGGDAAVIGAAAVGTNPVILDPTIVPRRGSTAPTTSIASIAAVGR